MKLQSPNIPINNYSSYMLILHGDIIGWGYLRGYLGIIISPTINIHMISYDMGPYNPQQTINLKIPNAKLLSDHLEMGFDGQASLTSMEFTEIALLAIWNLRGVHFQTASWKTWTNLEKLWKTSMVFECFPTWKSYESPWTNPWLFSFPMKQWREIVHQPWALSRFRLATRLFGGRSFNLPSRRTGTPCKLPNTERNLQETLLTSLGWNIWKKTKFNMSTDFASSSAFFFVTVTCKQWRRCSRDQTFKVSLLPIQSAAPLPLWFWYPEPAEWNKNGKRSIGPLNTIKSHGIHFI